MAKTASVITEREMDVRKKEIEKEKENEMEAERKAKKNLDFVQQSRSGMKHYRKIIKKSPLAAQVFSFLSEYMNYENAVVCSSKVLQEYFEVSRTSIFRAVKILENDGFIIVGKSGNSNMYTLNPEIVWSSYGNNKKYCVFEGKILLSESENKEIELKAKKFKQILMES